MLRYDVYRNGEKIGEVPTPSLQFVDSSYLVAGSTYAYAVSTVGIDQFVYPPTPPLAYLPPNCPLVPDASLRVQVFQVGFVDVPVPQTAAAVDALMFGPEESVGKYWAEVSYGRQTLSGSTLAVTLPGVISSYCVNEVEEEPGIWEDCATERIKQDLVTAVVNQVNFWDIERAVLIVYGFRWRGSAGVLTTYAGAVPNIIIGGEGGIDRYDITTIVHEFGHNGGAGHASTAVCPDHGMPLDPNAITASGCSVVQYRDHWDPMGIALAIDDPASGKSRQDFGGYHKEIQGFLRADEVTVLNAAQLDAAGTEISLSPIEALPGDPGPGEWGNCTIEPLSGPYYPHRVAKILLADPVHLSIEARLAPPSVPGQASTLSNAIVRIVTARRNSSLSQGTTFLAHPPSILDALDEVFEDLQTGIRVKLERRDLFGGYFRGCNGVQVTVSRIPSP